ncbi:MAG: T9SS type B sorting domain-containing protein [Gelidibacter sp.]
MIKAKKRFLFIILLVCLSINCFSQRESANWYFGNFAGLTFNSGSPIPLTNSALNTKEGCATISDENGNLKFYTDGTTVWDRQHHVMPHGENLLGHSSSTESAIIIPKPGNTDAFYIFTIDKPSYFLTEDEPIDGVNYSEVDMTLNNGYGDIVVSKKNIHLITYDINDPVQNEYKTSEKITAVTHSDGSSIWVITQFINKFYSFRVDFEGVNHNPVISVVPQAVYPRIDDEGSNISAIGYLKVSPNGKKIAIAHSSTTLGSPSVGSKKSGKVLLYDFNNTTGIVTNERTLLADTYPYGVEFSPNSKLLYVTTSNFSSNNQFLDSNLYQFNLDSSNIPASKQSINGSNNVAGALQLAIDGKIYRSGYPLFQQGLKLSVINNPNELGSACNYSHNSIDLAGRTAQLGLPPFVQSIFNFTFDFEYDCFSDMTHFFITSEDPYDSVLWDFGDGETSTLEEPIHVYSQSGTYMVSLSFTINGITQDPIRRQLTIHPLPQVLQTTYELVQCDGLDENADDGFATFNLNLANEPLTLNTSDPVEVFYYHSLEEALEDDTNENAMNPVYINQSQNEILYAKIYLANTKCFNIGKIMLKTTQSVELETYTLEACDAQNNGVATFDLNIVKSQVMNQLNLPNTVEISFHESEQSANIGVYPVALDYTTISKTLYIRVVSDNVCYGTGVLHLIVLPFAELEDETIEMCQSDFPIILTTGLSSEDISNYDFFWSTNETTSEISIENSGVYTVTVTDNDLNCEGTKTITVTTNEVPVILSIDVMDGDAAIILESNFGFEFAVDSPIYQESNQFQDLSPGTHIAYVRDRYNCNTIQQEFQVLGFPKFFTPNDDGSNDFWNVKGLDFNIYPVLRIYIFNRYGKLISEFNPNTSQGWSGKFNNKLLPSDDYWYYLKIPNGKVYRGHFALKL